MQSALWLALGPEKYFPNERWRFLDRLGSSLPKEKTWFPFESPDLSFCLWQLSEDKVASLSINGGWNRRPYMIHHCVLNKGLVYSSSRKNKGKWNFTAKGKEELWFNSAASVVSAAPQANQPTNRYASQKEEIESSFCHQECKFPTISLRLELEKLSSFRYYKR
jgi:hypothetical protein